MTKAMQKPTVTYRDLMKLGFPEHASRDIIRQAKRVAVKKFDEARKETPNMLALSRSPFDNRRLGIAPTEIVEGLIGISLSETMESVN